MSAHFNSELGISTLGFCSGFVHRIGRRQNHSHATVTAHFRLSENAQLSARFCKNVNKITELHISAVAFNGPRHTKPTGRRNVWPEQAGRAQPGHEGRIHSDPAKS